MIKAVIATSGGSIVVLGLDRENTRRMHAGSPVVVQLDQIDPRLPSVTICVMAGESNEAITAEIERSVAARRGPSSGGSNPT